MKIINKFIIFTLLLLISSILAKATKLKQSGLYKIIAKHKNDYCDKKTFLNENDVCSVTVTWIKTNFLTDKKVVFKNIEEKADDDKLSKKAIEIIRKELKKTRAVIVSIRPDHHFLVYKNKNYIELYQSSAKVFYLKEWMDYYYDINTPKLNLDQFLQYLYQYVESNHSNVRIAAKKLFTLGEKNKEVEKNSLNYYCDPEGISPRLIYKVYSYKVISEKVEKKNLIHSINSDLIDKMALKYEMEN